MKEYTCKSCGDTFTADDLREFREMGEAYNREKGCFLCPDCWDSFQRLPLEDQMQLLMK